MKVNEKKCKSILSESGIYDVDYSINPYVGCEHGCKYCYATFMKRFTNHSEDWGEFVDVKTNSINVLEKDLMKKRKGSILLSSVTDPYQPLEEKYKLTRKILMRLSNSKFTVNILTKSNLILRDIDILKKFNPERISVGLTINFLDDRDREIWEPKSAKIHDRIETLEKLSKADIDCYVHVGPYLEGITDLNKIFTEIESYVEEFQVEGINLKENEGKIMKTIKEHYPHLKENYETILKDRPSYLRKLKEKTRKLKKISSIPISLFLD